MKLTLLGQNHDHWPGTVVVERCGLENEKLLKLIGVSLAASLRDMGIFGLPMMEELLQLYEPLVRTL